MGFFSDLFEGLTGGGDAEKEAEEERKKQEEEEKKEKEAELAAERKSRLGQRSGAYSTRSKQNSTLG